MGFAGSPRGFSHARFALCFEPALAQRTTETRHQANGYEAWLGWLVWLHASSKLARIAL